MPGQGHSAKYFLKINKKNFAECLGWGTRQSNFFKKIFFFCRVLGRSLGKITVNGRRRNGRKYFAECPDKKHSTKTLCREKFCRADFAECYTRQKPLPSAKGSLPSVKTLGKAAASSSAAKTKEAALWLICRTSKRYMVI